MTSESTNLCTQLRSLISLEADTKYECAQEVYRERSRLRHAVREHLHDKTQLPSQAEHYAGLQSTQGRVSYRAVAEELARRLRMGDETFHEVCDEYRAPGQRLRYGRQDEVDITKLSQLEFDFMTPQGFL